MKLRFSYVALLALLALGNYAPAANAQSATGGDGSTPTAIQDRDDQDTGLGCSDGVSTGGLDNDPQTVDFSNPQGDGSARQRQCQEQDQDQEQSLRSETSTEQDQQIVVEDGALSPTASAETGPSTALSGARTDANQVTGVGVETGEISNAAETGPIDSSAETGAIDNDNAANNEDGDIEIDASDTDNRQIDIDYNLPRNPLSVFGQPALPPGGVSWSAQGQLVCPNGAASQFSLGSAAAHLRRGGGFNVLNIVGAQVNFDEETDTPMAAPQPGTVDFLIATTVTGASVNSCAPTFIEVPGEPSSTTTVEEEEKKPQVLTGGSEFTR